MCTAATYTSKDHYFGRNLDLEFSYHESVTITPRRKVLPMRHAGDLKEHYALIGMAFVVGDYPLYYDATNEKGLSMAGLNFPGNAHYTKPEDGKDNIASFEFIPWILGQCATVEEARQYLSRINLTDTAFSEQLPPSPLHWMIADQKEVIVFEQTAKGAVVYDNPVGVMTNNPTFDMQMVNLANYRNVTAEQGECRFAKGLDLHPYSRGMGGLGLPGDLSSASRFVKVAFTRMNSVSADDEVSSVSQFFHILHSVTQQRGCCKLGEDKYEITIYSSCMNLEEGIYYYTTYDNSRISAVNMHHIDLTGNKLSVFDLVKGDQVLYQN